MSFHTRHLPHWHPADTPLFVTFNLHGAIPRNHFPPRDVASAAKAFVYMHRFLDAAQHGPAWMKRSEIATIVADAIRHGEEALRHYELQSWVVMSNHVHLLITPQMSVPKLMAGLKGFTAKEANKILNRTGEPFWQREYYDHWVRDKAQFDKIARYIEDNPVRAGVACAPEEYRFSSAYAGRIAGMAG